MRTSSLSGSIIHNVLARTIGRHGLRAPEKVWKKKLAIPYANHLFGVQYNEKTMSVEFTTDPVKTPHMILAERFLRNGVNLTIPLVATADGQLELDTRKGNLPTRWPLMLYDFVFNDQKGYSCEATVVSYTDPSFNSACMDAQIVHNAKYAGVSPDSPREIDNLQEIDDMNDGSYIPMEKSFNRYNHYNLLDIVAFYKHDLSGCNLHIDKGPPVTREVIDMQIDSIERRKRSIYSAGEYSNSYWWSGDQTSSMSTKMFIDKCVSASNDYQKYRCDVACSQGALGFPRSSHYLAMHILFGKDAGFTSTFDGHNDYCVRYGMQFEELVVLHENIKKYGGSSTLRSDLEHQYASSTIPSEILRESNAILKRVKPVKNIVTTS